MQCDTQTLVLAGPADYHTPILGWCAVRLHRSGRPCLFFFPPQIVLFLECRTESLFSVHGGRPWSLLSDHTMQSPFALAMWQFPHSQVFRDCDGDDGDDGDGCLCSRLALVASLVYTVVQPLSKVSGVFMIVNNKGKLATPQRSCYIFFISFFPVFFFLSL